MKVLHARVDGRLKAEDFKPFKAQLELEDGNHPITNKSIYRHETRDLPAIMLVWQNITPAEGELDGSRAKDSVIAETDYTKLHKQKPSVSKRWVRSLIWALRLFGMMLILTFGMIFVGMMTYALLKVIS